MRALLDINVLIALFDTGHQFHARARTWLEAHIGEGWASTPLTQNGFVRVISQPEYPNQVSTAQAIERLRDATQSPYHVYWPDDVSIVDPARFDPTRIHGPKQLTDVYLLAIAVRQGGCFATFDERISLSAVPGATAEHLRIVK